MKKSNPYHRCALLVLVACLGAAAGCGRTPVDRLDLTTLLPGDPAGVMAADLQALRQSEVWREVQSLGSGLPGGAVDLELFLEDAGIDPEKDLDRMMAGLYPDDSAGNGWSAVLTGRFSLEVLQARLEEKHFSPVLHRGHTVLRPPPPGAAGPESPIHFAWHVVCFDSTAVGIAGTRESAMEMIDLRVDGGESLDQDPGLGPLLAAVDRTNPLWGAGLLPDDAVSGLEDSLPMRGMIPTLENLAFSARVTSDLHLTCITLLGSEPEASKLASQLNGWVKLGAGLIQANPQWFDNGADGSSETLRLVAETLGQVTVSASGTVVRLETGIPLELIREAARPSIADRPQTR